MDIHVTSFSSSVIEAEKFNIPSVITRQGNAEYFSSQYLRVGRCWLYMSENIINKINHQFKKRDKIKQNKKV